jgi:hypothetical protein
MSHALPDLIGRILQAPVPNPGRAPTTGSAFSEGASIREMLGRTMRPDAGRASIPLNIEVKNPASVPVAPALPI